MTSPPFSVHVRVPMTRKVHGYTEYKVLIDNGMSVSEVLHECNCNPAQFIERFDVLESEIIEEFDNHSEVEDIDFENVEVTVPS